MNLYEVTCGSRGNRHSLTPVKTLEGDEQDLNLHMYVALPIEDLGYG